MRGVPDVARALPRGVNPTVTVLLCLAALQALFFLLPFATAVSRLTGIALGLSSLLAARLLRDRPGRRTMIVTVLALFIGANFVVHLFTTSPNFPFRIFQVAIVFGYAATLLAAATSLVGVVTIRQALLGWMGLAGLLTAVEFAIGGPETFSLANAKMEWIGRPEPDSLLGLRFTPGSVVKSTYPDNPRGYFDEPNALESRWNLQLAEGGQAKLEFPADRRDILRVNIAAPGTADYSIGLNQSPIRLVADERYEVRFRARADSVRNIHVVISQAHPPWQSLGFYRELRVDTTWREFTQTFRATGTDRVARLFFALGAERPSVELSSLVLREISTNRFVQPDARREHSVSYRINSQGCRSNEYPDQRADGSWRVLAMGDGSTFGVGVHQGDTYSARLETMLNASIAGRGAQTRFEVVNCGVPGSSTKNEHQFFTSVGARFSPNVVLLSVSPDDDRNTALDDQRSVSSPTTGLERFFHSYWLIGSMRRPKPVMPDYSGMVSEILQFDAEVRSHNARLAVVLFQHNQKVEWNVLDSTLAKGLAASRIPVLKLGPKLLPFGVKELMVDPLYDPHPNELAHRVTAEAIWKFLSDEGLLGSTRGTSVVDSSVTRRR